MSTPTYTRNNKITLVVVVVPVEVVMVVMVVFMLLWWKCLLQRNIDMGLHGIPGNSREFQGIPGNSREFQGIPGNSKEFLEFQGIPGIFREQGDACFFKRCARVFAQNNFVNAFSNPILTWDQVYFRSPMGNKMGW